MYTLNIYGNFLVYIILLLKRLPINSCTYDLSYIAGCSLSHQREQPSANARL